MTWNNPHPTSKPQLRKPPSSSKLLVNNNVKRSTPHPTSKSQPRKLAPSYPDKNHHESQRLPRIITTLTPTGPTPTPTGCKRNISDSTRAWMIDAIVWALRYVSFCSFLSSSNYYLGSELLMTVITRNEPRLHIPILHISNGMWVFLLSVLGRRDLRGGRGVSEDLRRLYGGQVRTSLSL